MESCLTPPRDSGQTGREGQFLPFCHLFIKKSLNINVLPEVCVSQEAAWGMGSRESSHGTMECRCPKEQELPLRRVSSLSHSWNIFPPSYPCISTWSLRQRLSSRVLVGEVGQELCERTHTTLYALPSLLLVLAPFPLPPVFSLS